MPVDLSAAWTAVVGSSEKALDCWAGLIARWTEPHRRYHGIGHLSAVLLFVDEYGAHAADIDAVRLAAWYHDAIYDPRAADNEERSAQLAVNELGALGLPSERVHEVARLVRLTASHEPGDGDRNGELLNDADLMILGSPPEAYVAYLNAIREEYAHVPDPEFRAGRAAVLEALLDVPRLYRLAPLAPMEAVARQNMTAELSLLRSHPGAATPADQAYGRHAEGDAAQADADQRDATPPRPPGH
ncbi:MAG: HD domain-containing protein [Geodermatophilaceae bacterium]